MALWAAVTNWFKAEPAQSDEPQKDQTVPLRESAGTNVQEDMTGWTRLSSDTGRDLNPVQRQRMVKMSAWLWQANLIANRLIELPVAYLLAEGVKLVNEEDDYQKVLDRFWRDPINNMDIKLEKKVRELALFGEQFYPAFVNEMNGHVRLGYLDPNQVAEVVFDPDNPEQPIGVITKKRGTKQTYQKYKVIINGPEDVFTARTQQIRNSFADGEIFYFNINAFCNQGRGHGDLTAQADYLDLYDEFLFGEGERSQSLRAFVWDVTLTGADQAEVNRRAAEIKPPSPNSVNVHNDREKWEAQSPSLNSGDTEVIGKLFRNHILSGATMPPHWFADAGDVNRANGESMGEPTLKMLTMRQRHIKHMLHSIATYVLRQYELAHGQREPELDSFAYYTEVNFPEITAKDTTKYAAALQQVCSALILMIEATLISEETALQVISSVCGQLGVAFDAVDELAKAREAAAERKKRERDSKTKQAEEDAFVDPDVAPAEQDEAA